jgi:hypothetical protein
VLIRRRYLSSVWVFFIVHPVVLNGRMIKNDELAKIWQVAAVTYSKY